MALNEQEVLAFLQATPDFLATHAATLNIRLPEQKVLSFNQGKLSVLQQKTERMAAQLATMLDDVEYNRHILAKLLSFNRRLLAVNTVNQFAQAVSKGLTADFDLPNSALRILVKAPSKVRVPRGIDGSDVAALREAAMSLKTVQCGTHIAAVLLNLLHAPVPMESFLQLPIVWHGQTLAIVVVGHQQADHFHAQLSTDFVNSMAQSMATLLARLFRLPD